MKQEEGYVVAFHNDEESNQYLGLAWRDRAIRETKRHLAGEIVSKLFSSNRKNRERILKRISLESGISNADTEVLEFVEAKIGEGKPIFLDFTLDHAEQHNASEHAHRFRIASVFVNTDTTYELLNKEIFSPKEVEDIERLVRDSQGNSLKRASQEVVRVRAVDLETQAVDLEVQVASPGEGIQ